jgi:phosphoglycolate phosphatase
MRHKVIVFDFDGTLVDSNEVKTEGFARAFADRPECVQAIPETLASHKLRSRHEIIASLVRRIGGLSVAQRTVEILRRTEGYSAWVESRIVEKSAVSPAGALLPQWRANATLYVCSLTPREYLERIIERIGWLPYFEAVEGYPLVKREILVRTAVRHGIRAGDVLMVGDSNEDEAAAAAAATAFFRVRDVGDLFQLDRYLRT